MKIKKKRILLTAIITSFILCALVLFGCSHASASINAFDMLANNMTKIANTLNNVKDIDNSELILNDFMQEGELSQINSAEITNNNSSTNAMNSYFAKITTLNNSVISTVELNSEINNTKQQIYSKSGYVKELCSQAKSNNINLSEDKLKSLKDLNTTLMINNTRINHSRNEINNNLKIVQKEQAYYSARPEYLASKYTKLKTSLNTRLSYYHNLSNSLDSITNILCENCGTSALPYIADDYFFEETQNNKLSNNAKPKENLPNDNAMQTFTKNIDTYENAGTNIYGDPRNNPIYNKDNYLRNINPGYGMGYGYGMPHAYNMGGYGMGYGMGYGGMYNYGMPYNNGYLYPNINSFGTYKNIDTYKSRHELDNKSNNSSTSNNISNKDGFTDDNALTPTTYPMPRPEPIPRPYPTQKPTQSAIEDVEPNIEHKPMPLPNFDEELDINQPNILNQDEFKPSNMTNSKPENAQNDDEQFVDKQEKPKIEKIIKDNWVIYSIEF